MMFCALSSAKGMNVKMDKTWTTIFYQETNPVRRMELLRENTGNGERKEEQYRNQLWIARYGKSSPVKDEFVGCLLDLKYLAEVITIDWGGKRRKQGMQIIDTFGMSEIESRDELYHKILLEELQNVFLKYIEVSRNGRDFTSFVFGVGQLTEEGIAKKIAQQINMIAFQAPHLLHMDKEFALLQEAALLAFRQLYPNKEYFSENNLPF